MRCWVAAAVLAAALPLACQAEPVERPDGMVEVVIDGSPVAIASSLAEAIAAAVAEHGNDPDSLAAAIGELLGAAACDTASACERLAAAAVVYAVSKSSRDADIVAAIVQAAAAAVPAAGTEALLAAVGSADGQHDSPPITPAQATVQPPRSASPTQ